MIRKLIDDINRKKLNNQPYASILAELENNLNTFSLYERSQALAYLLIENYESEDTTKAELYLYKSKNSIQDCFRKKILDKNDYLHFCHLLSQVYLIEIKLANDRINIVEIIVKGEDYKYIKKSCVEILYFLLSLYQKTGDTEFLSSSVYFCMDSASLSNICDEVFTMENIPEKITKQISTMRSRIENFEYYFIFLQFDSSMIEIISNLIISKNNNLLDIDIIISNTLKTSNFKILKLLICKLNLVLDQENVFLAQYNIIALKLKTKSDCFSDLLIRNELKNNYFCFMIKKKKYEELLDYKISITTRFYCLLKLYRVLEAEALYEEMLSKKYKFKESLLESYCDVRSNDLDFIDKSHCYISNSSNKATNHENSLDFNDDVYLPSKYIFKMFLQLNNTTSALNILQNINEPVIFCSCLKKSYKDNKLVILKEGILIGVRKFGCKNQKLAKIFISFCHIEELNIPLEERLKMIDKIFAELEVTELFENEKTWFYNVAYNNAIDALESKNVLCSSFIKFAIKCNDDNNEILHLILLGYLNIKEMKFEFDIQHLFDEYALSDHKDTDITLLFYEILELEECIGLIKPIIELKDEQINQFLLINNNFISFRIEIIKEAERRKIFTKEKYITIFNDISIYGPQFILYFIENTEFKRYFNDDLRNIIYKQIEFLKIVKNLDLTFKFEKILEDCV